MARWESGLPGPLFCYGVEGGTDPIAAIDELIAPALADMGYELVQVRYMRAGRLTLQVMVERRDRVPMTVEDCAEASRAISAILDVADPIEDAYTLEVSSPGIDRPLVRAEDYDRFRGFEARIETEAPIDGRRRFKGVLEGVEGDAVRLLLPEGAVRLPLAGIRKAKLVLTDALIEAVQSGRVR
jgi:ribosome maturation factor RimP